MFIGKHSILLQGCHIRSISGILDCKEDCKTSIQSVEKPASKYVLQWSQYQLSDQIPDNQV